MTKSNKTVTNPFLPASWSHANVINIFDPTTGRSLGTLKQANGTALAFDDLWALLFVDTDLYFTAGIADEAHGLFGEIEADE